MSKDASTTIQATPEQLVAKILATLREDVQLDAALLDILSENIVKIAPTATAVADAVKAIEELAAKRAEETADDPADHD